MNISRTAIDDCLWKIKQHLIDQHGVSRACRDMMPLVWYIETGRASVEFIRKILQSKPYIIGRRLHAGGSYDDVIKRISKYIKYSPN